jgi:quercetin dioxygenase-like cupin family protein
MHADENDVISIGQLKIRYLRDGSADGTAGMFEMTVPPGAKSPPAHSHDNEEIVYCLEGVFRSTIDGVVRDLNPGDFAYTPSGTVHSFSNPHDQSARVLVTNAPDIGAQYFRDIAEAARGPTGPDPAKISEVMRRYGLTLRSHAAQA